MTTSERHFDMVLESLRWTKQKFQTHGYPDDGIKQQRIAEVDEAISFIRELKNDFRKQS